MLKPALRIRFCPFILPLVFPLGTSSIHAHTKMNAAPIPDCASVPKWHTQLAQTPTITGRANPRAPLVSSMLPTPPFCLSGQHFREDCPSAWGLHSMARVTTAVLDYRSLDPLTPPQGPHWQPCSSKVPTLPPHTVAIDLASLLPSNTLLQLPRALCQALLLGLSTDYRILPHRDG